MQNNEIEFSSVKRATEELERAALGATIMSAENAEIVLMNTVPEYFTSNLRALAYAVLEDLLKNGVAQPDLISMSERASQLGGDYSDFMDELTLCEEAAMSWHPDNVKYWCEEIKKRHLREEMRKKAAEVQDPTNPNPDEALYELNQINSQLLSTKEADGVMIGDLLREEFDRLEKVQSGEIKDRSIKIGLNAFDDGGGMRPGELWTIAAQPGGGKSVLALQAAEEVCRRGESALFFSLEMSRTELVKRLWSGAHGVDNENLTGGKKISTSQWMNISRRCSDLHDLELKVFDKGSMTSDMIASICRRHALRHKIGLIVVDYLQIITPSARAKSSEHERLAEITRNMKILSKDTGSVVMLLSQLNKEGQKTEGAMQLHHLAGSSGAANDSDAVIFVSRPVLNAQDLDQEVDEKEAYLDRKKYRHGRIGTYSCVFDGQKYKFRDRAIGQ